MALGSDLQTSTALGAEFSQLPGGTLDPQVFRQWESAARLAEVKTEQVPDLVKPSKELPKGDFVWSMGQTWVLLTLGFFAKVQATLDPKFADCGDRAYTVDQFLDML